MRLGKNQKELVKYLELCGGYTNSWDIQINLADNGSHWGKCLLPSLHTLVKRGIIRHYIRGSEGTEWLVEEESKQKWISSLPSHIKVNNRQSSIWELVIKEV